MYDDTLFLQNVAPAWYESDLHASLLIHSLLNLFGPLFPHLPSLCGCCECLTT